MGGAVGVLSVARALVSHAAWYVRYQVEGTTHDEEPPAGDHGSDS